MGWTRLSLIAIVSFLTVVSSAFFKKSIALSLCSVFMFNSVTCHAYLGDISRANAALAANSSFNNNEAEIALPNISERQEVADICLFGICAPVDLPGPIEDIVEDQLNDVAIDQLRPLFADEIPITGSNHEFYDSVVVLPGEPFAPQLLQLNALPPDSPIPPGDYEIPAHFYCTKIYSFDGQGNRFPLARLDGQMADVLSALYSRASYDSSISTSDIQMLSWAIQTGMSYNELSDSQQALADRLIPDYRDRMESSFVERLTGIVNNASQISGNRLPGVNEILDKLGPIGDAAGSLLQAREQILRTNYSYQTLAQQFAPQQDAFLEGGTEETPWSQTRENVYMRFIAPDGAMDDGTIQIRIVDNSSAQLDPENSPILVANLSPEEGILSPSTADITAEDLTEDITSSVGVPEASGAQAITASLPPAEDDGKCDLMVVLLMGFDWSTRGLPGRETRIDPPSDGLGTLQRRIQEEMSKYPNVSLNSQIYTWEGKQEALADIENAIENKKLDSLIIIGHSFGADTANSLAHTLSNWEGEPYLMSRPTSIGVDMLIQIDSVGAGDNTFPTNVGNLINYFQTSERMFAPEQGVLLSPEEEILLPERPNRVVEDYIPGAENIDATARFDRTLTHTNIDNSEPIHQDIVTRVSAIAQSCSERVNLRR